MTNLIMGSLQSQPLRGMDKFSGYARGLKGVTLFVREKILAALALKPIQSKDSEACFIQYSLQQVINNQ